VPRVTDPSFPGVRLLTVCGSLQRRSANRSVLDAAAAVAEAAGATVEAFAGLADLPAFDPDRADDPIPAVTAWRAQVGAADAVLIAAPEYAGALAGAVKNACDWLVMSGDLYRTPVAVLSAGTSGGGYARRMLAQTLTWQGAYVVAEVGIDAVRTKLDDDGHVTDGPTRDAVVAAVRTLLGAPARPAADVVALATEVVGRLGIETGHVTPAV
jgi:chromate reductase, NAD(P)H dehydrogenase (quinone)